MSMRSGRTACRGRCSGATLVTPFITSDSGVGVVDVGRDDADQVSVLGSEAARLLIPIHRDRCLQIGPVGAPMFEVTQRDVTDDGAMTVNLAMYGWATRFIFADQQSTAQRLRATAKRSPARVPRPRPYHHHVLIDREEGDNSLADSHRRAGRTPYVRYDGVDHDYVILRDDKELAREALRAMAISKTRAERKNGTTALQSDNMMISPLEITRRHRET